MSQEGHAHTQTQTHNTHTCRVYPPPPGVHSMNNASFGCTGIAAVQTEPISICGKNNKAHGVSCIQKCAHDVRARSKSQLLLLLENDFNRWLSTKGVSFLKHSCGLSGLYKRGCNQCPAGRPPCCTSTIITDETNERRAGILAFKTSYQITQETIIHPCHAPLLYYLPSEAQPLSQTPLPPPLPSRITSATMR